MEPAKRILDRTHELSPGDDGVFWGDGPADRVRHNKLKAATDSVRVSDNQISTP